jgi:hypothetical protein
VLSGVPGALGSPSLALTDYFLLGYVKSMLQGTCPANIDDLKQRILACIQGIA